MRRYPPEQSRAAEYAAAGTFALDALVQQANDAGAKVLLVGDWAQLSAVEAGGAFSMLVRDRDIAPELSDVRRFVNGWEKTASVGLRVGNENALDTYQGEGRIQSGTREQLLDALCAAWKDDSERVNEASGRPLVSLIIAGDRETVTELNRRARADLVAAGQVTEDGLALAGGSVAGVGDRVVTRQNERSLLTGRRRVKNGDAWTVTATSTDGSMTVRRPGGGGEVVLPADYVREHVELGYATTAHRAQGRTVDTAHAMVAATTSREVLYVAATRSREANHLYVDTCTTPTRPPPTARPPNSRFVRCCAVCWRTSARTAPRTR